MKSFYKIFIINNQLGRVKVEEQLSNFENLEEEIVYEELNYYGRLVDDLEIELFREKKEWYLLGMIQEGIRNILSLRRKIQKMNENDHYLVVIHELNELLERLSHLETIVYTNSGISLGEFLTQCNQTSITHLVYTNNQHPKIRLYSTDSYMFLCQFHRENTPSLGVTEHVGCGYCFGCGKSFNTVQYLMEYENLSYQEAVQILARIYLIKLKKKNKIQEDHPLVIKYQESLLSDDFRELLERGYQRVLNGENNMEILRNINKFERDFLTIERIKNHTPIHFDKKKKTYYLKMPTFNTYPEGE